MRKHTTIDSNYELGNFNEEPGYGKKYMLSHASKEECMVETIQNGHSSQFSHHVLEQVADSSTLKCMTLVHDGKFEKCDDFGVQI